MKQIDILKQLPFFASLTPAELQEISQCSYEISFLKGAAIYYEGDQENTFFIILSGEVSVWSRDSLDCPQYRLTKGDFFGEVALVEKNATAKNITATKHTTCLALKQADFRTAIKNNPMIMRSISSIINTMHFWGKMPGKGNQTDTFVTSNALSPVVETVHAGFFSAAKKGFKNLFFKKEHTLHFKTP